MLPVTARGLYIKQEATADPRSMARIERMLPFIHSEHEPVILDDAGLQRLLRDERPGWTRHGHGVHAAAVEPVVLFNQFLYEHPEAERERRRQEFPELFQGAGPLHYAGYGGFDWRHSGSAEHRRNTGLVCQPGYALHSFWGCHFRCAYCAMGHIAQIYANVEDWVHHIERNLDRLEKAPDQILFQWDNGTDNVCWEPEYGATRLLVELFARQPDKHLEIYVGKSDHVDYLLDFEHRGHTLCCWSLCHQTQAREIEPRSADLEARLRAARKCQEAGYPVRIRFSPMVPTVGWEQDIRHMIRRMCEEIKPSVLTVEPLRFYTYEGLCTDFAPGTIDPEFMQGMKEAERAAAQPPRQFPDHLIARMYRLIFAEMNRLSPRTPIAFCREKRTVWDDFRKELQRTGQDPDDYVCNCGPLSAANDPRLLAATATKTG